MIYLYLFGTCFHFIYVFMIIGNKIIIIAIKKYLKVKIPKQSSEHQIEVWGYSRRRHMVFLSKNQCPND